MGLPFSGVLDRATSQRLFQRKERVEKTPPKSSQLFLRIIRKGKKDVDETYSECRVHFAELDPALSLVIVAGPKGNTFFFNYYFFSHFFFCFLKEIRMRRLVLLEFMGFFALASRWDLILGFFVQRNARICRSCRKKTLFFRCFFFNLIFPSKVCSCSSWTGSFRSC